MNAIEHALTTIKIHIPDLILKLTFNNNGFNNTFGSMVSIDEMIREKVIRDRVMPMISNVNGESKDVPLHKCEFVSGDVIKGYIYHIPKSETEGRNVVSIVNVTMIGYGHRARSMFDQGGMYSNRGSEYTTLSAASIRSASAPNITSYSNFKYNGNNNVYLPFPIGEYSASAHFRCIIENDANMANISRETYNSFGKLCVLAAKTYIYNEMSIKLDQGYIEGGAEIGVVKDIIDDYSDAAEEFMDYIENTWELHSVFGDQTQRKRITALLTPGSS